MTKYKKQKSIADINGRPWAKLSELKVNDKIYIDGGFEPCFIEGSVHIIDLNEDNELVILGNCGSWHAIQDQADDGEHCIGIYKAE